MGYVYVIGQVGGPYKVGHTSNPDSRLSALNCASPHVLSVQYLLPHEKPAEIERLVHAHLAGQRLSGEWFESDLAEITETVDKAAAGEIQLPVTTREPYEPLIGGDLKAFRKARKQSQAAFGAELGVDRKTVQRWEHGETSPPGKLLELACETLQNRPENNAL